MFRKKLIIWENTTYSTKCIGVSGEIAWDVRLTEDERKFLVGYFSTPEGKAYDGRMPKSLADLLRKEKFQDIEYRYGWDEEPVVADAAEMLENHYGKE